MGFRGVLKMGRRLSTAAVKPSPNAMVYDRAAELVKSKLKRESNPDPRFLKHNFPHPTLADHTPILGAPATRITTLPNGLRVATESNMAAKTATVGVWIEAGSRFESDETNGTANFLQQILFWGTKTRCVAEEVEDMGGLLNAYITRDQTAYFVKVLDKDVAASLDILSDILQNPAFKRPLIREARHLILGRIESNQQALIDHLYATAFQHTSLGRTIPGPAENIRTIRRTHLKSYISTHYTAPRMVIAASGAVNHEDVVAQVQKYFTNLSTDPTTASQLVANDPASFTGSEVRMIDDDVELAQFAIAFSGPSFLDPDSVAVMVMQFMLGAWNKKADGGKHMGSGLVQRVSINEIAESILAFNEPYRDAGLFGIHAVAKPDCLDDLAWAIMHEMSKLCYRVSDDDVTRACNQLKSSMLRRIAGGTTPIAQDIGHQLLNYGRRIPYAELFARIDAVDASAVKRVANHFIYDRDVAIAAMGPVKNLPDYNWFRRRTYWNRY